MAPSGFKKVVSYLTEGVGLMTEFWVIGILHEIGRNTVFFNGNVNKPDVGYFIAIIFSLFYLARFFGSLAGLLYSVGHRFIFISLMYYIGTIVGTLLQGYFTSAVAIVSLRVFLGFMTGFTPVMCIIRGETDKVDLASEVHRGSKNFKPTDVKTIAIVIIEFVFSYGFMCLAAFIHLDGHNNIFLESMIFTAITLTCGILFFIAYGFFEPRVFIMVINLSQEE